MFTEVWEIRFWWTKRLHSFVSLPPGIFMTCIDNTNQPWQYVTIVTIGLWLVASQQSCQGQFIQQHWLIWQEAAYLSLEPGTDKPWLQTAVEKSVKEKWRRRREKEIKSREQVFPKYCGYFHFRNTILSTFQSLIVISCHRWHISSYQTL